MENRVIRLLLIEDDEDDFILLSEMLKEIQTQGYAIEWVTGASEAFPRLESMPFDICLVDYRLGLDNGIDIIREATSRGIQIPFILLTGIGDRDIDIAAMQSGASDYLNKNELTHTLLERTIRYAINSAHTRKLLVESQTYLASILSSMRGILFVMSPEGIIETVNQTACDFLGYNHSELSGMSVSAILKDDFFGGADYDDLMQHGSVACTKKSLVTKDGREIPVLFSSSLMKNEQQQVEAIVNVAQDITEITMAEEALRKSEARFRELSIKDVLTGAYNRLYFMSRIEEELNRSLRTNDSLGLIMIDIDHFKNINDTSGHLFGDFVLVEITRRIKENIRPHDVLARFGGEEFVILLTNIDFDVTREVAERIRKNIKRKPIKQGDHETTVTISAGIASSNFGYSTTNEIIQDADQGLYKAKNAGRDRIAWVYNL